MLKSESISSSDWHNLFVLVHRVCLWDYSGPTHMNLSIEKAVREVVYEIRQVWITDVFFFRNVSF